MKIKELVEFDAQEENLLNDIIEIEKEISILKNNYVYANESEEIEIEKNLKAAKRKLEEVKKIRENLKPSILYGKDIYINRNMLGNEVAKLMSDIMEKEYVYKEDYIFEIDDGSKNCYEYRHINILKEKVFTVVDKKFVEHEPYIEYYDVEEVMNKATNSDYWKNEVGYVNDFETRINNKELFTLPFLNHNVIGYSLDEEFKKGNTSIHFSGNDYVMHFDNEARINYYHSGIEGYSKIINDFLTTIFAKGLYIGRDLTQEEIAKVRTKFIELYRSGYDFTYYEDGLYNLEDVKVYKKDIEK